MKKSPFNIFKLLGPGLITGASDDDPSGIATYSQVGAKFGFDMLWTMLISYPMMTAVQEISARIGRITGRGLAGNMRRFYSAWITLPLVALLVAANIFNLGADIIAMGTALTLVIGGSATLYGVLFTIGSLVLQIFMPYTKYSNYLKWLTLALFAYVATAFVVHVPWGEALRHTFLPRFSWNQESLTAIVAVMGTTISPYLFFWQASTEVEEGRKMVWSRVALDYARSFERARHEHSAQTAKRIEAPTLDRQAALPVWRLDHLICLTDDTGMLQHAVYTLPNYEHGYCTDDNARALILMMLLEELEEGFPERTRLTSVYAAFLQNAFDASSGRFRNFMSYHRDWIGEIGSEDSHGRALWALGTCVGRSRLKGLRSWAAELFEMALLAVQGFTSPRAWAFAIIGLHEYLRTLGGDLRANQLRAELAQRLRDRYEAVASPDWLWFEDIVTYDNARIPQSLIMTGRWANQPHLLEIGLRSLRWLAEHQIAPDGHFRPIGSNGFWKRGDEPALFDQQPVEAHAMICACLEAYEATGDSYWLGQASKAFEWFHGSNDLGLALYDAQSGGCRDGLHIDRVNENQGAESALAFLLSLAEMRRTQDTVPTLEQQVPLAA